MTAEGEHDDDLEPEVIEGAEIETQEYREDEDQTPSPQGRDLTPTGDRRDEERQAGDEVEGDEQEGDASDTI
jgi:hypothetical protein